jgi:hypothetical protein
MKALWEGDIISGKSVSNKSLKQVAILITLAKTQNFFSNNSSNQLVIYPHLLFTGLARGKDLLSRSRGHYAEGEASRAASATLLDGLGAGAEGRG